MFKIKNLVGLTSSIDPDLEVMTCNGAGEKLRVINYWKICELSEGDEIPTGLQVGDSVYVMGAFQIESAEEEENVVLLALEVQRLELLLARVMKAVNANGIDLEEFENPKTEPKPKKSGFRERVDKAMAERDEEKLKNK